MGLCRGRQPGFATPDLEQCYPFEMRAIRAMPDGFEIEFTEPVDIKSAEDIASYSVESFIYKYHPVYGSPVGEYKEAWHKRREGFARWHEGKDYRGQSTEILHSQCFFRRCKKQTGVLFAGTSNRGITH
jgi:hypothetical protein